MRLAAFLVFLAACWLADLKSGPLQRGCVMVEGCAVWKRVKSPYALLSDATVFVALAAIVLFAVSEHEPWADEAETWVEVRDIPWLRLMFSQLRYDGHLPLWHAILWVPIHCEN
jgi:hypothetical protein